MTVDPHAMLDAALDSAIEISLWGFGALVVQRLSAIAMIDPHLAGVLYGIAAVMVGASKLVRAIYAVEQPENWIEKKIRRLRLKKGKNDASDDRPSE